MDRIYLLEWTFSPPDYFEEPVPIVTEEYEMVIENGRVEAKVKEAFYDEGHKFRDRLHESLNYRFLGIQFLTHKPFELSKPGVCRIEPDGRKTHFVSVEGLVIVSRVGPVDMVVTNKDGNIIADTRRERIEKKKTVAELAEKHGKTNPLVNGILNSYRAAVLDPANELVHLYEIREALMAEFRGEQNAQTTLGISSSKWKSFGALANNAPIRQGSHRGQNIVNLRDATHSELQEAREFAQELIWAYLNYLEENE